MPTRMRAAVHHAYGPPDDVVAVEEVGAGISSLRPGDAVFGWGTATFAELATIPAEQLVPMPEGASFEEMAGLPVAGTVALQALRDIADVQPGEQVLVNGASGGIGSSTVQIAKHMGAVVAGVCSTANLDLVRRSGRVRSGRSSDGPTNWPTQVRRSRRRPPVTAGARSSSFRAERARLHPGDRLAQRLQQVVLPRRPQGQVDLVHAGVDVLPDPVGHLLG